MRNGHILAIYKNTTDRALAVRVLQKSAVRQLIAIQYVQSLSRYPSLRRYTAKELARYYQQWLLPDEAAVLISVSLTELTSVQRILRENTAIFALYVFPEYQRFQQIPGRSTSLISRSASLVKRQGAELAKLLPLARPKHLLLGQSSRLAKRLRRAEQAINSAREMVKISGQIESSSVSVAEWGVAENALANKTPVEWLLDNWQVIRGQLADIYAAPLRTLERHLPQTDRGVYRGLPRIYLIAVDIIESANGQISMAAIESYIHSYQAVSPLYSDELEVLPLFLKLALVEYAAQLCRGIEWYQHESDLSGFWISRISLAAEVSAAYVQQFAALITDEFPQPSPHLTDLMVGGLQEESIVIPSLKAWMEGPNHLSLATVLQEWHGKQSAEQLQFRSLSQSLKVLSHLDQEELLRRCSILESVLSEDPSDLYRQMESSSRKQYRTTVRQISVGTTQDELAVARLALDLAAAESDQLKRHVGYFLIDQGRLLLESEVRHRLSVIEKIRRAIKGRPTAYYFTISTLVALVLTGLASWYLKGQAWPWLSGGVALFFFLALDISTRLVQQISAALLPVSVLPKLDFQKGIPKRFATSVVVPTLLLTSKSIASELERLEVRYLSNPGPNLTFGLLTDFSDAPYQNIPEDDELLESVRFGIEQLNQKYQTTRFFLFHRERSWSDSERAWIGWERKRGKLEQFNAWMMGEEVEAARFMEGEAELVRQAIFVITLDADTQLALETAERLVGTLAHPLNRARLSPDGRLLEHGYTIIQPQVSTTLPSATATLFSRIFTSAKGVDPYSTIASDFYQDLTGETSYQGKGIYEPAVFHALLHRRLPESRILSHDLLEGSYVRTGLASDIELFDLFPANYASYSAREHRWIRGDWQIMAWLGRMVLNGSGQRELNPLTTFEKWKILDNLRRSLLPIVAVVAILIGWFVFKSPFFEVVVLLTYFFSPLLFTLRAILQGQFQSLNSQESGQMYLRALTNLTLLPHSAYISSDAIIRTLYRQLVSHRYLLEWQSAAETHRRGAAERQSDFLYQLSWIPLLSLIGLSRPSLGLSFTPSIILLLWLVSPLAVFYLQRRSDQKTSLLRQKVAPADLHYLRLTARKTWRYFVDFMNEQYNWLPPDNYQVKLRVSLTDRTSPTNIGLGLLSVVSAHDFGYLSARKTVDILGKTIASLQRLERRQGHFLNWYAPSTGEAIGTKYISMVDSGNLLGSLWGLEAALQDLKQQPLARSICIEGIVDTLTLAETEHGLATYQTIRQLVANPEKMRPLDCVNLLQRLAEKLHASSQNEYWQQQLTDQVTDWNELFVHCLGWMVILQSIPSSGLRSLGAQAHEWRRAALTANVSLEQSARAEIPGLIGFLALANDPTFTGDLEVKKWLQQLAQAVTAAQVYAEGLVQEINALGTKVQSLTTEMDFTFLYNKERRIFHIGYNVEEQALDDSYYTLLASEARLGSFLAIACGQVPLKHWWALGRRTSIYKGNPILLSWSGTMFEYLMPVLWTGVYENSLLDQASRGAVASQKAYADGLHIPWGVSESGYSAIDSNKAYQYFAFGSPGLGLRRGLEDDLVVAPYASILAVMINPIESIKNLHWLEREGLAGDYGFYEAIDYSREGSASGKRGVVVYSYMAHHQGMSLMALNNLLHDGILQRRFHTDPRVKAYENLLFEKIPLSVPEKADTSVQKNVVERVNLHAKLVEPQPELVSTISPRVATFSNGAYSLAVSHRGGGYATWRQFSLNRWRPDVVRDHFGQFFYVMDSETTEAWSPTLDPLRLEQVERSQLFTSDKVLFKATHNGLELTLEITISPEEPIEVRKLTLINRSLRSREVEITSFQELALATSVDERTHPVFSSMFVQTEWSAGLSSLLAWRRRRSEDDQSVFATHTLVTKDLGPVSYETDRQAFIGRGGSISAPASLRQALTKSTGYVLDPIFAIRKSISLAAGAHQTLAFLTIGAESRVEAVDLVEKYQTVGAIDQIFNQAWTASQLNLRALKISSFTAQQAQQLAASVIYKRRELRAAETILLSKPPRVHDLWSQKISGDLPIVVVSVKQAAHLSLVQQLLSVHSLLHMQGVSFDLVVLDDSGNQSYFQQLKHLVLAHSYFTDLDQPGGIFLRSVQELHEHQLQAINFFADVVLKAGRGSLGRYLATSFVYPNSERRPLHRHGFSNAFSALRDEVEHGQFANGRGSFSADGSEYRFITEPGNRPPTPWSNVLANQNFGTLLTDNSLGMSWHGNSQTNRITPWSNDPVGDTPAEVLYIRNEKNGEFWSATPLPSHAEGAYIVTHSQGYSRYTHSHGGVDHELTITVPVSDTASPPLKLQKLSLHNTGKQTVHLSIFHYAELVLGRDRETGLGSVITEWDAEHQLLLAYNPRREKYERAMTFLSATEQPIAHSGNRTEFFGEGGRLESPQALRVERLDNRTGAGYDPCIATQYTFDLAPNERKDLTVLLGEAPNPEAAIDLATQYQAAQMFEQVLQETKEWWKQVPVFNVQLPDKASQIMINHWLPYQVLCCRIWARSAFYQSGGAFGFRDQLQDVLAMIHSKPAIARSQILASARRQFAEGDVQHWWHPDTGMGVRTRISDDLLWLPFVSFRYAQITGSYDIFSEELPFLTEPVLEPHELERTSVPVTGQELYSLYIHCQRAVELALSRRGVHGLPLIGTGDWNDGLSRVGVEGRGESVWLAWFLCSVLDGMVEISKQLGHRKNATTYATEATKLRALIETVAWDGNWYLRAFYDDGSRLGSRLNKENTIDSLSQSWSVLAAGNDQARQRQALAAVEERLVRTDPSQVLLFTPPFEQTEKDPGYVKSYPPGVRENGGQYTHGSLWVPQAFARLKEGNKAVALLQLMNPILNSDTAAKAARYAVEPYVMAADVYALHGKEGRGGWTWYTGSASWMYTIWIEEILGIQVRGQTLVIDPVIPAAWDGFSFEYRHQQAHYHVTVHNPTHCQSGVESYRLNGEAVTEIKLESTGLFEVEVMLG